MSDAILLCPACAADGTHVYRAYSLQGCDPLEPEGRPVDGQLYDIPVGGVSRERRGCLVVEIHCECGHVFELKFQQHKGQTLVSTELLEGVTPYFFENAS